MRWSAASIARQRGPPRTPARHLRRAARYLAAGWRSSAEHLLDGTATERRQDLLDGRGPEAVTQNLDALAGHGDPEPDQPPIRMIGVLLRADQVRQVPHEDVPRLAGCRPGPGVPLVLHQCHPHRPGTRSPHDGHAPATTLLTPNAQISRST